LPPTRKVRIADLLSADAIIAKLSGYTAETALAELCSPLGARIDQRQVLAALLEREQQGSTGMRAGLAIPHARIPGLPRLTATFGRSLDGIDFRAMDGHPTHFFFALFVPEERPGVQVVGTQVAGVQLQALARISSLFDDPSFPRALLGARDAASVYALITQRDEGPKLDALTRGYLTRVLGHEPTRADARSLPGIDVSDL
jgi:PTS system nitrogen regulatory IIA component